MTFSRTLRAAVAAVAVAAAVLVPALPASAAIPDPVIPLPVTGSQMGAIFNGAIGQESAVAWTKAYIAAYQLMRGNGAPVAAALAEANKIPKPIALPSAITRGSVSAGAAGGTVLSAGMLGWGIGSNGTLAVIAAAQGSTYEDVFCSQPGWYQGVTGFVNFGIAPDCTVTVTTPNADASAAPTPISYPGLGYQWQGARQTAPNGGWWHCFNVTSLPSGHRLYYSTPGRQSNAAIPNWSAMGTGYSGYCTPLGKPGDSYGLLDTGAQPLVRLYRTSDFALIGSEVAGVADPQRTLSCRVKWSNGTTTTGTGASYKEGGGLPISLAGTGCGTAWSARPSGTIPEKISVDSDGGTGIRTINEHDIAPEMMPAPGGDGSGLRLEKVVGTTVTSCMTWEANCSNWWGETDSGQVPGVYRCTFGGASVALTECGPYRYTFDAPTSTPTITNPSTGTTTQWSSSPSPGNSTNPGTGPGTGQWPADQCFAEGYSSVQNPVDWVLLPVKCALVWAFVPRTSTVTAAQTTVTTAWESSAPGSWANALTGWAFVAPGDGCGGVTLPLSTWFGHGVSNISMLNSCPGSPLQFVAGLCRTVIFIMCALGLVMSVTRSMGGMVGTRGLGD